MSSSAGVRWRPDRVMFRRHAFAWAYLACYLAAELVWVLLTPRAQATLTAWASTNVANLEHEPIGPLVLSAFVGPGYLLVWPVLIALAVFGASQASGNARTALICVAGQVIGSLVSEGIAAVGHLTALVTAAAAVTLTLARRGRTVPEAVPEPAPTGQVT
jgi:hypothetical protein